MATSCKRKLSNASSDSTTDSSPRSRTSGYRPGDFAPQSDLSATAAARRRGALSSTTFRVQLAVFYLLLLLLTVTVSYLAMATRKGGPSAASTSANDADDPSKQAKSGACDQHASAQEQYREYLTAISNAQVVHVAAKSKAQANSRMDLCGQLLPQKRPSEGDTFVQLDGGFQFNFSQDERFDVLLRGSKGYKWVTEVEDNDDSDVSGTAQLVHTGCLHEGEMPPVSSLGDDGATVKTARWVKLRKTEARDGEDAACERALEIKFAGEAFVLTEQRSPPNDDFVIGCLEDFQSEREDDDEGDFTKLLRVESVDLVLYLALSDKVSSTLSFQDLALSSPRSLSSCPMLPTTIHITQPVKTDASDSEAAREKSHLRVWQASGTDEKLEVLGQAAELPEVDLSATDCPCHDGMKTCLFVHGIGVHEDVGVVDDFEDYWGKQVKNSLPCCSVIKFTHFDTVDPKWYHRKMSKKLCRAAIAVSKNETYLVSNASIESNTSSSIDAPLSVDRELGVQRKHILKDMLVVAHSTGNLHLAAAALYGDCELDKKSSRWIAIQGPMSGTMTANRVIKECRQPNTTWDAVTRQVLVEFELCPITGSTQSLALRGTVASSSCLDQLYEKAIEVFQDHVCANMCGISPVGILSSSSARFVALDKFSNHTSKQNDGAVDFDSCRGEFDASTFDSSFASRFYKAEINHDDGRMVNGDGLWGETRKPLKWLQCRF